MRWIYVRSTLAKYVRSELKFNAKNIRLALNELNLCKIYAKFNAKYVRSTQKLNAKKYVRLSLIALNLCKIYAKIHL